MTLKTMALVLALLCGAAAFAPAGNTGFVRVRGNRFDLAGQPYYFAGANFWQGMNLAVDGVGGDRARLCRELDRLRAAGVTNLRVMAASEGPDGEPYRLVPSLQSSPGVYNAAVFQGLDYLLDQMNQREMRAVMVLNNFWHWSGGMAQYVSWSGGGAIPYPPSYPDFTGGWDKFADYSAQFYASPQCQAWFQSHISTVVNRTNTVTGAKYKDDPTIFAWELGNEPRGYPSAWIDDTAAYIKSLDANHLVTTGVEGEFSTFIETHNGVGIDYATVHIWPQNYGWYDPTNPATYAMAEGWARNYFQTCEQKARNILGKPIVLEEFGLARDGATGLDYHDPAAPTSCRDAFYAAMFAEVYASAANGGAACGANFWAWGGEARPASPAPQWLGDPPHETPGWYSVYDTDASTLALIAAHATNLRQLVTDQDTDEDGMSDAWEQQIVDASPTDGITSVAEVLPGDDYDGDGGTNAEEYFWGTNPCAAESKVALDWADAVARLRVIGHALTRYKAVHGADALPPRLGKLVTEGYLAADMLVCRADPYHGALGGMPDSYPWTFQADDAEELYTSFFYEFSEAPCPFRFDGYDGPEPGSWYDVKMYQLAHGDTEFRPGPYDRRAFPVVRCFWIEYPEFDVYHDGDAYNGLYTTVYGRHDVPPTTLNLAMDFQSVFASPTWWELEAAGHAPDDPPELRDLGQPPAAPRVTATVGKCLEFPLWPKALDVAAPQYRLVPNGVGGQVYGELSRNVFSWTPGADAPSSVTITVEMYRGAAGAEEVMATKSYQIDVHGWVPGTPDLLAACDTGLSPTDRVTSLDNSSAAAVLAFSVSSTIAGATVGIFADGAPIGSAVAVGTTTTVSTSGSYDLADGAHSITARQTEPGQAESSDSSPLIVTVDTQAPTAPAVTTLTPTDDPTPTWTWTSGGGGNGRFRWQLNGEAGLWTETDARLFTPGTPLALGTHTLYVQECDAAGNWSVSGTHTALIVQPNPDLVITAIRLDPVVPALGGAFTAYVTVQNIGSKPAGGGVMYAWLDRFAEAQAGLKPDRSAAVGALKAGQIRTLAFTSLRTGAAAGQRTFRAFVDAKAQTAEVDETNNQATLTWHADRPDFIVTAVAFSPNPPAAGKTFTATVKVKNQGESAGDAGYVDVWVNQVAAVTPTVSLRGNKGLAAGTLQPGQEKTLTFTALTAAADDAGKTFRAVVDSRTRTLESDETNNQFALSYQPGRPDFVITNVVFSPDPVKCNSTFNAYVTVKNVGLVTGASVYVDVWANHTAAVNAVPGVRGDKSTTTGTLQPNQEKTLTFTSLKSGAGEARVFRALVDSRAKVTESDETNNQITESYRCGSPIIVLKPNIYLYPTAETRMSVRLVPGSAVTKSDPVYPAGGWECLVAPGGMIDGKYGYLFYEALVPDVFQTAQGWIVPAADAALWLAANLPRLGLNARETQDFLDYWPTHLPVADKYVFYPQWTATVDLAMPLVITPAPDSVLRLWFVVRSLTAATPVGTITAPTIQTFARTGFAVVAHIPHCFA